MKPEDNVGAFVGSTPAQRRAGVQTVAVGFRRALEEVLESRDREVVAVVTMLVSCHKQTGELHCDRGGILWGPQLAETLVDAMAEHLRALVQGAFQAATRKGKGH